MKITVISLAIALCLGIGHADAQGVSEEARRHFDRGMAAVEMAKTNADYEDAIREFENAARLAPNWPDAYYNLGMVQEKVGKYEEAIRSYKQYLRLAPDADDAGTVRRRISRLEYKKEKAERQEELDFTLYWTAIGVDVTKTHPDGTTEKIKANARTVRELLAKGADPNAVSSFVTTSIAPL